MANPPPSPNVDFRLKACGRHIALVEADPVRQGVSRRSIQALGARVTILPSWARLCRRVQFFAFDLIVFGHQADLAKGQGPSDPSPPAPAETPILMLGKRSAMLRTRAGHEPLAWAASCRATNTAARTPAPRPPRPPRRAIIRRTVFAPSSLSRKSAAQRVRPRG